MATELQISRGDSKKVRGFYFASVDADSELNSLKGDIESRGIDPKDAAYLGNSATNMKCMEFVAKSGGLVLVPDGSSPQFKKLAAERLEGKVRFFNTQSIEKFFC